MPTEAQAGFREVSARRGTSFDWIMRSALERALQLLTGVDENRAAMEAEAPRGAPPSAEVGAAPASVPVAEAAAPMELGPAASEPSLSERPPVARKDVVQAEVSGQPRELLDELCRCLRRPRDVVLVQVADAMREATVQRKS